MMKMITIISDSYYVIHYILEQLDINILIMQLLNINFI